MNQFRIYTKTEEADYTKSQDEEQPTFMIKGVASTSNKDIEGDVVMPSAIKSMKQQLMTSTKNLHGDHQYGLDGILGVVKDVVETDDDKLIIKAAIRQKYIPSIKEMLDLGINLGLSIGGSIKDYDVTEDGWIIKDINLMEISLTGMPANWDTYGTIEEDGPVSAKCLGGACALIRKQFEENKMVDTEEKTEEQPQQEETKPLDEEAATQLFNELMASKEEEIVQSTLNSIRDEVESLVKETMERINEPIPEKDDRDESLKSLIQDTITKSMDSFYADFNNSRTPQPHVDEALNKSEPEEEIKKDYTPAEAAEKLFQTKSAPAHMIQQALNDGA